MVQRIAAETLRPEGLRHHVARKSLNLEDGKATRRVLEFLGATVALGIVSAYTLYFIFSPRTTLSEKIIWPITIGVALGFVGRQLIDMRAKLPPPVEDISATNVAVEVLSDDEFGHYADDRDEILQQFATEVERVNKDTETSLAGLQQLRLDLVTHAKWALYSRQYATLFQALPFILLIILTAASFMLAFPQNLLIFNGHVTANQATVVRVLTPALAVVFGFTLYGTATRLQTEGRILEEKLLTGRRGHFRRFRAAVDEGVRRAINEVLKTRGIVAFPTAAPRLVELDASAIEPSQSLEYVRGFITGHDSSAIGIAGSRGSGKSTILRALVADKDLTPYSVLIPAPISYDGADFSRRLLRKVAATILDESEPEIRHLQSRVARSRDAGAITAILIGAVLVAGGVLNVRFPEISVITILGVVVTVYGATVAWYSRINALRTRPRPKPTDSPSTRKAGRIIQTLASEVERGASSKNIGKLSSLFELQDEDSVKLKERALTHADITEVMRDLLETFAGEPERRRFIICIDELDKLATVDGLVRAVNSLKDLFHIQGVHFVVGVSTEALASFEQRGLPNRDAFDSSFDTVLAVRRLSVSESVDIIASCAAGFPPVLALFCHTWAGGLARDLLRAARRCVEIQREKAEAIPIAELVRHLVVDDLVSVLNGLLPSAETDFQQIIWELKTYLLNDRSQSGYIIVARQLATMQSKGDSLIDAALAKVCVGLCIIEVARSTTVDDVRGSMKGKDSTGDASLETAISLLGIAMEATGTTHLPRSNALMRCIDLAEKSALPDVSSGTQ